VTSFRLAIVSLAALVAMGTVGCGSSDDSNRSISRSQPSRPDVTGLTADSQSLQPGGETSLTVSFGANSADAGAGSMSADAGSAGGTFDYTWTVDAPGWSLEGSDPSATLTAPDTYGAEATVSVVVRASAEIAVRRQIAVRTVDNQTPRITSLSAEPNPLEPTETTTLTASAEDGNGDELSYAWTAPEGWSLGSNSGETTEVTAPDRANVSAEVTLTVSDGGGGTATASVALSTRRNEGPSVTSMTAEPPQIEPTGTSTVRVDADDPEGDEVSYDWSVPDDWTLEGEGREVDVTAPDQFGASATIRVTVEDGAGNETTASIQLSTPDNDGPVVQTLDALPQTVEAGGTIDLSVSATDPDGDSLSYNWSVADGDWSLQSNEETAALTAPDQTGVRTQVSVTVDDGAGHQSSASILVSTRANRPPNLAALDVSPQQVAPGGTVTARTRASDPNGDSLSYSWSVPSNWTQSGQGSSIQLQAPDQYGASGTVQVTIEDGNGGQATATVAVTTRTNTPPTIGSLTARPPVVQPGGTSTLEVVASDPNGDGLNYNWTVPTGWTEQSTGSSDTIDVVAPGKRNRSARIRVEVTDGAGGTATAAVVVRTRLNQPPLIDRLTAQPDSKVKPGDTIQLQAAVRDPDDSVSKLSYNWQLPKGWKGSSQSGSITVTAGRTYQTKTISLTVDDGQATASASVQIDMVDNREPTIQSLQTTKTIVRLGQSTKATVNASDPLGDPLSYQWSLANSNWTLSGSGKQVTITAPNQKSSTTLTATVSDGFGQKTSKTVTLRSREQLYNFSSHTFTTCGERGRKGPTLSTCRQAYKPSWVNDSAYYDMNTRGYQKWTVPKEATYRIEVAGAQGGQPRKGNTTKGAIVAADVRLQAGDTLLILVGQRGHEGTNDGNGGRIKPPNGGGGTFVALGGDRSTAEPLLVAGGGAGASLTASTSTPGVDGPTSSTRGGTDGDGGNAGSNTTGAGGGFYGDGADGAFSDSGGASFRNGGLGGQGRLDNARFKGSLCNGGFGGGGGCDDITQSYPAGGGYSGGGPGPDLQDAGGGGSFVADEASNVATSDGNFQDKSSKDQGYSGSVQDLGQWNTGPGSVQITKK
jgi:predicted secreted protein